MITERVDQLWDQSARVLDDCALPSGAIVAANTDLPDYPRGAEGYRYVWMRDNAFQLAAASAMDPILAAELALG